MLPPPDITLDGVAREFHGHGLIAARRRAVSELALELPDRLAQIADRLRQPQTAPRPASATDSGRDHTGWALAAGLLAGTLAGRLTRGGR